MHYSMYYREEMYVDGLWPTYDVFISAYNASERVRKIFEKSNSLKKFWLIFPEYEFSEFEYPSHANVVIVKEGNEALQVSDFIGKIKLRDFKNKNICIDSTGFLRAQLLFLMAFLKK
ncbi:hypothetical protein LG409_14240 [Halomonas sp. NyZ770]|uniref:hypothetical protein n=1 Tax=Halomonas sp. NyZ770 TaxID=2883106 RepID=UPI001D0B197D|nr:hypothetical protein [Halomonas sp. NyZ770]UDM06527.1 hypothetical protein LG409_14240 [Halomonas sp. NyZ770]